MEMRKKYEKDEKYGYRKKSMKDDFKLGTEDMSKWTVSRVYEPVSQRVYSAYKQLI